MKASGANSLPFLCWISLMVSLPFSCGKGSSQTQNQTSQPQTSPSNTSQGATTEASAVSLAHAKQTDVLVIGGTPSGVAAAIAAARQGAKVILVEPRDRLGGDIVYALLNMFDLPMSKSGTSLIAQGIFGELFKQLGVAFDVKEAEMAIEQMVKAEPNITLLRRTHAEPVVEQNRVIGAQLFDLRQQPVGTVRAGAVVDATNDADFAARAGASFTIGRQTANPDRAMQSTSLLFEVAGVDWKALQQYARGVAPMPAQQRIGHAYASDAAPTTSDAAPSALKGTNRLFLHRLGGVDGNYIWERGDLVKGYVPKGPDVVMLSINFGQQESGNVILNTLNVLGVNGLSRKDRERGKAQGEAELKDFLPYLRGRVPGFAEAKLVRAAPELYIRETRHLQALYTLTVADIRAQKQFDDRVALVSYPIDLHPYKKGDSNPFEPQRYFYTLPVRSLVPRGLDGLFVASRCLGATYEAAGSARVIPATMAAGQATGVAAAQCVSTHQSPQQLVADDGAIGALQGALRQSGAELGDTIPGP